MLSLHGQNWELKEKVKRSKGRAGLLHCASLHHPCKSTSRVHISKIRMSNIYNINLKYLHKVNRMDGCQGYIIGSNFLITHTFRTCLANEAIFQYWIF